MSDYKETIIHRIEVIAGNIDVDPKLLTAIIQVESSFNPWAIRYEPTFGLSCKADYYAKMCRITEATERMLQKCSWGVGQIMGATARSLGMKGELTSLCDIDTGLFWAATYLKKTQLKYPKQDDAIAAYNAGTAMLKDYKHYVNQDYVNRVALALKGVV